MVGAILGLALLVLSGCGGDLPKGAVAKVGQTTITQEQFDAKVKEITEQLKEKAPDKSKDPAAYKEFEQKVLDYMITLEVAKQKAPELKAEVTDADVTKQLDQVKQYFGGDEAKFQEALKKENLTVEKLKANLTERVLLGKVSDAATKDATVPDAELQKYYDEHKAEFKQDETRKARHILVAPNNGTPGADGKYTDAQWQAALVEAEKLRQEILKGKDFAAVAKESSDDPGSKDQGGDLGDVQKGTMVPEFDKAVFSQEKGVLSEPVKTQFGYHIIQVMEINPAKQLAFADVKEQIKSQLLDKKKSEVWDAWLKKAKEDLKVIVAEGMAYVSTTSTTAGTATTAAGGATDTTAAAAATTTTSK